METSDARAPSNASTKDTGSQSIIIDVTESTVANVPIIPAPDLAPPPIVEALPTAVTNGPPPLKSELLETAPPVVAPRSIEPVSPAVRYVARRERNRRNQFTIAVILLLAVIVLAGILIWVLKRGSSVAPAEKAPTTSLYDSSPSRYFAVSSHARIHAYHIQVATQ